MKETIKSATMVIIINLLNLLITTLFGFLVSICLDYDNYAYYKLYGLYVSFVGFGHFGFINGIYLKYGRYNYEELPRDKFCVFFRVLLLMQLLVVLILAGTTAVSSIETIKKHVLLYVCMNLSVININCYFALVNQFTKRFRYDCYAVIGKCIVEVVLIVLLLLDCICDGNSVLFWVFVENMLMLIINIINNRTIVFGHCKIDKYIIRECRGFVKVGFFVMISEFIGLIVLGIDGLFVDYYFGLKEFAIYSFATTIISIIYAMIGTISNLIYPYMVRAKKTDIKRYYNLFSFIILWIVSIGLCMVKPVCVFINNYMVRYSESAIIIYILSLTLPFKAVIVLLFNNMFKVIQASYDFLKSNIFAMVCSVVMNGIGIRISTDIKTIAVASVITMVLWYVLLDVYFVKKMNSKRRVVLWKIVYMIMFACLFERIFQYGVGVNILCGVVMLLMSCLYLFVNKEKFIRRNV